MSDTRADVVTEASPEADSRPRILCLHGGGVTAAIFESQCRLIIRKLPDFRLVFVDAPFISEPIPGITTVYGACGPFRRWLRAHESHYKDDDETIVNLILTSIDRCKMNDAGTGSWVGILGFSQGAKIAASILYQQQIQRDGCFGNDIYSFGVLMAGRGPLVSLSLDSKSPSLAMASDISTKFDYALPSPHILTIPTIHLHGLQDEGLLKHRQLAEQYCAPHSTTILEWNGAHRVPYKPDDVSRLTDAIYRLSSSQAT